MRNTVEAGSDQSNENEWKTRFCPKHTLSYLIKTEMGTNFVQQRQPHAVQVIRL